MKNFIFAGGALLLIALLAVFCKAPVPQSVTYSPHYPWINDLGDPIEEYQLTTNKLYREEILKVELDREVAWEFYENKILGLSKPIFGHWINRYIFVPDDIPDTIQVYNNGVEWVNGRTTRLYVKN